MTCNAQVSESVCQDGQKLERNNDDKEGLRVFQSQDGKLEVGILNTKVLDAFFTPHQSDVDRKKAMDSAVSESLRACTVVMRPKSKAAAAESAAKQADLRNAFFKASAAADDVPTEPVPELEPVNPGARSNSQVPVQVPEQSLEQLLEQEMDNMVLAEDGEEETMSELLDNTPSPPKSKKQKTEPAPTKATPKSASAKSKMSSQSCATKPGKGKGNGGRGRGKGNGNNFQKASSATKSQSSGKKK